jgi:hypothetical protein
MYRLNDRKTLFLWQINSANDGISATGGIMVVEDDKASSMSESDKRMSGWVSEDMSLINQVNKMIYIYKYKYK